MATKIVRFARIKRVGDTTGVCRHYAGHYPLPCIEENDVVKFVTMTLDVTVKLHQDVRCKFINGPQELKITPNDSPELVALGEIQLLEEFRVSNFVPEAVDWEDGKRLNYVGEIDPCPPWPQLV